MIFLSKKLKKNSENEFEYYIKTINYIQYFFFLYTWIMWWIYSPMKHDRVVFISIILLITDTFRHFVAHRKNTYKDFSIGLILIDLTFVFWISSYDPGNFSFYMLDILIAESIVFFGIGFGFFFTSAATFACIFSILFFGYETVLIWRNIASFSLVFFFMAFVVKLNDKRKNLRSSTKLLNEQKELLEKAYKNLRQSSLALEEMTILRERNRIAREIHDSVGHALTAVIVQIEAAKRLMDRDKDTAILKIEQAQEQIRIGLDCIRTSVRTLKEGNNVLDFSAAISALTKEAEAHTGIKVITNINTTNEINGKMQKIIYRALQEGLTNGIKHGNASVFNFSLSEYNFKIFFTLEDNGKGCEKIIPGFGLSAMKERVEELNGHFEITSTIGKGFKICFWFYNEVELFS